jgi:hypothetical protein
VIGNFRPSRGLKPRHKNSRWCEDRDGMSDRHLAALRKCPCVACLAVGKSTVHHLKSGTKERGMSVRSTDKFGVPLCMADHEAVERAGTRNEVKLFQSWGVEDPHALALALWGAACDVPKMMKIVIEHRGMK